MKLYKCKLGLAITSALFYSGQILAEDTSGKQEASQIEVIEVTSQKRVQNMQKVPISTQAFTADMIEKLGADTLTDLAQSSPSIELGGLGKGSQQQMGIRGLVDFARNPGIDSRMGIYIDGVFQGRSYSADVPLLGLESVEVLRGPQGTLFGKNTVAGAISLNTRRPTEFFEGEVSVEAANHGTYKTTAFVSGELADNLFGSISGSYQSSDGYYNNTFLENKTGDWDTSASRGQLRYVASDKLEFILSADWTDKHSAVPLAQAESFDAFNIEANFNTRDDSDSWGSALTVNYDLSNDYIFTSISAYREASFDTNGDDDYGQANLVSVFFNEDSDQVSQEFRLVSPKNDVYDWVAGMYYFDSHLTSDRFVELASGLVGPVAGKIIIPTKLDDRSIATYIHGNYRFNEQWELTAGLRFTNEEKNVNWQQNNVADDPNVPANLPGGALGAIDYPEFKDDFSDSNWSPTVGLNYFATDDVMVYGKVSRAYKSGGWNTDFMTNGLDYFAYDTESMNNAEFGIKSMMLDYTLKVNASVFYSDIDDFQVFQRAFNANGNPAVQLTNAGEAHTAGFELETVWLLTDNLTFTLNTTFLETGYDQFLSQGDEDYSGNKFTFAPDFKGYLGAEYFVPIAVGELSINIDYSYSSSQYTTPNNSATDKIESYKTANARVTYISENSDWQISAWVKNITDDEYLRNTNLNLLGARRVTYGEPITYGVNFKYMFE
jgi:iron complex outermembrane receptor protein